MAENEATEAAAKPAKAEKQTVLVLNPELESTGCIRVSPNVIAQIIKKEVLAVDGVARFAPKGVSDIANLFSGRAYDSSIGIAFEDDKVDLTLSLIVYYGSVVPAVIKAVQEVLRDKIENLVGAKVGKIDVLVKDLVEEEPEAPVEEEATTDGEGEVEVDEAR